MIRRTFQLAWFKRNRYFLTVIAIALSVAFIVSTLLLTTSISDVGAPLDQAYAGVEFVVEGQTVTAGDGPVAGITAPVPADVLEAIRAAGHEAVGLSSPYAQVVDAAGTAGGQDQASANVAEPWLGASVLNGYELAAGTEPTGLGQALLDITTAESAGLDVGSSIRYVTDGGLREATLVGLVTFGGADNDPYTSTLLLHPDDTIFSTSRGYDEILVAGGDPTRDGLAGLATGSVVTTGPEWVAGQIDDLDDFLGFFATFLTVFAVVAVVVGMVIVTNTFTVSLAQRTEELALLRLVGTTRGQLMTQVVLEAIILGAVGTAAGVGIGLVGVNALGAFLDLLGLAIERSDAISLGAIGVGVIVGMGVTVLAAAWPAWKATAVAPIEALRSAELEPPSAGRIRLLASGLAVGIGVLSLLYGTAQSDIIFTGVGIGGLFLALYLGADTLVRWAARLVRPLLGQAGPTGTVASRNLERNAGRTAAASSALMIGISLIAFFTLMAATIGQFMAGDSADALRADLVVQGIGRQAEPTLGDDTLAALAAVDGVDDVVPLNLTSVTPVDAAPVERVGPGGDSLGVASTDFDALLTAYEFTVNAGSLDQVGGTSVVIDQALADSLTLAVGDGLAVTTLAGPVDLAVAAIIETSLPGNPQPAIIGDLDLRMAVGDDAPATIAYIVGDADEVALRQAIDLPTVEVVTLDDYIDGLGSNLDTILSLVYALLAVAVIIALVGIANTVSLAISERAGEIAAIRAAGASSRQIFWSLISEFGLLALVGVVSGLALAWVSAAAFFRALSDGQIAAPETDLVSGLLILGGGLVGGAAASWFPARRASRSDILDVLRAD